jgi:hypothetical protein
MSSRVLIRSSGIDSPEIPLICRATGAICCLMRQKVLSTRQPVVLTFLIANVSPGLTKLLSNTARQLYVLDAGSLEPWTCQSGRKLVSVDKCH